MRDSATLPSGLLADLRRIAGGDKGVALGGALAGAAQEDWARHGLPAGQLHEIHAEEAADEAAAIGFAVATALAAEALPLLWIRTRGTGRPLAGGLAEIGLPPDALLLVLAADSDALLRAAADAARCRGLGTVLIETRGRMPGLDLTATRRLVLAAEQARTTVLSVRLAAEPVPSAAATRWSVAAAGSTPLPANAPGRPAFLIECLRRRGGPAGARRLLEWNRDTRCFVPPDASPATGAETRAPPLSGAGLPLAADRAAAQRPAAPVRRAG